MDLKPGFSFRPLPEIADPVHLPFPDIPDPLGPLASLPGTWTGTGFNNIWRPSNAAPGHFLELNETRETHEFAAISGPIPNRGLLQPDINMFGVTYLQQISDAVVGAGLHIEPGIWAVVPETSDPQLPPTVVRMASIPHGTTILAQGLADPAVAGPPTISATDMVPFVIGDPGRKVPFPEANLSDRSVDSSRTPLIQIPAVTQAMVDNPNSALTAAIAGQTITSTLVLQVSTLPTPVVGGGTANTAFLAGTANGPNANAVAVSATFWIETVQGSGGAPDFLQLQYTQTVLLDFNGLSWPHLTVATLRKQVPVTVPAEFVDPGMPPELLAEIYKANEPGVG